MFRIEKSSFEENKIRVPGKEGVFKIDWFDKVKQRPREDGINKIEVILKN